jgi:hypothetical protein
MTEADHAGLWSTQKPLSKQISTSLIRRIAKKSRIIAGEWGRRGNSSVTYCDRSRSEFIKAILAHLHVLLESKSFSHLCQGRAFRHVKCDWGWYTSIK